MKNMLWIKSTTIYFQIIIGCNGYLMDHLDEAKVSSFYFVVSFRIKALFQRLQQQVLLIHKLLLIIHSATRWKD